MVPRMTAFQTRNSASGIPVPETMAVLYIDRISGPFRQKEKERKETVVEIFHGHGIITGLLTGFLRDLYKELELHSATGEVY